MNDIERLLKQVYQALDEVGEVVTPIYADNSSYAIEDFFNPLYTCYGALLELADKFGITID